MDQVFAPFTPEQVEALNKYQKSGAFHPFTCGISSLPVRSYKPNPNCEKSNNGEGILIATAEGWICPCGNYKQNWAHAFMADEKLHPPTLDDMLKKQIQNKSNRTMAVIVGRFQTHALTPAHAALITYAQIKYEKTLVVIGQHKSQPTQRNPLSFEFRKKLIEGARTADMEIDQVMDCKDDLQWSLDLDNLIKKHIPEGFDVVLLGSRDSFIEYYKGKFKTEYIELNLPLISATKMRLSLADKSIYDQLSDDDLWSFGAGIIHAICSRHPSPFIAVDIAVVKNDPKLLSGLKESEGIMVLMARKKQDGEKYRFIGGFVDSTDESISAAAQREVKEETGGTMQTDRYTLAGEARIDDWRYRSAPEKIFSNLFICRYESGDPVPSDDIDELKWFLLAALKPDHVVEEHQKFLQILYDFHFSTLFS